MVETKNEECSVIGSELRDSSWFQDVFHSRIEKLQPYQNAEFETKGLGVDVLGFIPEKMTAAILWKTQNCWEVSVCDRNYSGYYQNDHIRIFTEFDISVASNEFYDGLVVKRGTKICLLVSECKKSSRSKASREIQESLRRYGISKMFHVEPNAAAPTVGYSVAKGLRPIIDLEKFDRLIYEDWLTQVAETYALTITEWMRLKLIEELPEGRKPLRGLELSLEIGERK